MRNLLIAVLAVALVAAAGCFNENTVAPVPATTPESVLKGEAPGGMEQFVPQHTTPAPDLLRGPIQCLGKEVCINLVSTSGDTLTCSLTMEGYGGTGGDTFEAWLLDVDLGDNLEFIGYDTTGTLCENWIFAEATGEPYWSDQFRAGGFTVPAPTINCDDSNVLMYVTLLKTADNYGAEISWVEDNLSTFSTGCGFTD